MQDQTLATILLINGSSSSEGQFVHQLLVEHKYKVFCAKTIDEAIHAIQYILPDIVLINGGQTATESDEICRRIRNQSGRTGTNLPLIYLQPINGKQPSDDEIVTGVDDCFLFPRFQTQTTQTDESSVEMDRILFISNKHLLSLLKGYLRIRNLETSVEESQRQLSRAQRIMDRELGETAKMQRSFLPSTFPEHPELELAAVYQPSIKVGGDYYDIIPIGINHWGLVIADIAGHGSAAAVVMALTQMVVKEFGKNITSPQEALFVFNDKLNANLSSDHYVTMFYAVLDLRNMELTYAHAGHVPLMLYNAKMQRIEEMKSEPSFPLRTFDMIEYEEKRVTINPGDRVLFFTDGVVDIQNIQNNFYGADRLEKALLASQPSSTKKLVQDIYDSTEIFRGPRERLDDFTLMALGRKP